MLGLVIPPFKYSRKSKQSLLPCTIIFSIKVLYVLFPSIMYYNFLLAVHMLLFHLNLFILMYGGHIDTQLLINVNIFLQLLMIFQGPPRPIYFSVNIMFHPPSNHSILMSLITSMSQLKPLEVIVGQNF